MTTTSPLGLSDPESDTLNKSGPCCANDSVEEQEVARTEEKASPIYSLDGDHSLLAPNSFGNVQS